MYDHEYAVYDNEYAIYDHEYALYDHEYALHDQTYRHIDNPVWRRVVAVGVVADEGVVIRRKWLEAVIRQKIKHNDFLVTIRLQQENTTVKERRKREKPRTKQGEQR